MSEEARIRQLRERIDAIDSDLISLLSERLNLSAEIGRWKAIMNKPVIDELRESELMDRIKKLAEKENVDENFLRQMWQIILEESYRVQHVAK